MRQVLRIYCTRPTPRQLLRSRPSYLPRRRGLSCSRVAGMTDPKLESIYEKLIELYRSKDRQDWRKLMVLSNRWSDFAEGVFEKIESNSKIESDPGKKLEWKEFGKALLNVHRETERYNDLMSKFLATDRIEWEAIVAEYRPQMTPAFFQYVDDLVLIGDADPQRQEELKVTRSALISMVEMFDQATSDKQSVQFAKDAVQDILKAETVEQIDQRMDELAASGGLDGSFLLTVAKMYMSVKESPYTKEEVKDVMYHLYLKAKEATSSMQPPEVRILKHLLTIEDPLMLKQAIFDAFIPGGQVSSPSVDYLSTTPAALLKTLDTVLTAYETHKGKHTIMGETSTLMNPNIINKMRKLEAYIKKEFICSKVSSGRSIWRI